MKSEPEKGTEDDDKKSCAIRCRFIITPGRDKFEQNSIEDLINFMIIKCVCVRMCARAWIYAGE